MYDRLKLISEIHFKLRIETLQYRFFFILRVVPSQIYNDIEYKAICHIDNLTFQTQFNYNMYQIDVFKNVIFVNFFFKTIFSKCAF
jgi:hypothetical protein